MAIEPQPGAIQHVQLLAIVLVWTILKRYYGVVKWTSAEARMPEGLMGLKTQRFLLLDVI
jgi:hypothetical protein